MPSASDLRVSELRQIVSAAHPPLPQQPRPIVILGAGGIVREAHLPAYHMAAFPVLALADPQPGKAATLAATNSIPHSFDSVSDAIAFAPADAVFDIAVPASQLLSILPLLPRRAAVLMQKPMGETIEEARAIRDLCHKRELTAAVNFQLRYAPNHLGAAALAKAGVLGELHDLEVQVRTFTPWSLWTFLATAPRLEILYHSIHYIDMVRAWLGTPQGVYAKTVRHPATANLASTKSSIILDYGDARRVVILTQHGHDLAPSSQLSFVQWEGANGAIHMDMGVNLDYPKGRPDTLSCVERNGAGWIDLPLCGNWFPDAFIGTMGSLQAFLEGSIPTLPTSVESSFETMAIVEAAYLSSQHGGEPLPI